MQKSSYTVCIICNDDRVSKWGYALSQTEKFSRVFLVRSHYDFQEILPDKVDGSLLAEEDLPNTFDGILFHSSNADLWRSLSLKASHVFEFNTPGDPREQEGVIPIMRQTAPYFGIKPQDVEELSNYITGNRENLPLCCTNVLRPQILPGMVCLFYLYFSQIERGKQRMPLDFWREIWGEQPDAESSAMLGQAWKCQLEREWKHEWQVVRAHSPVGKASVEKLLQAFLAEPSSVTGNLIDAAYSQLRNKLGLEERSPNLQVAKPDTIDSIVALSERTANHALAAVLAHLWNIPYQVMASGDIHAKRIQRNMVLVISESQINLLKRFRLGGFSGGIVVVSTDPFSTLKQRHRVLRFGQGSHVSFSAPWNFEALLPTLSKLIPLAPENLHLLQREIEASSRLCQSHIDPCKEHLDFIDVSNKVGEEDMERLENAVSKIRADLPVACHAVISIETDRGEQQRMQIQEHFQAALSNIQSRDISRIKYGINQFRQVFSQLQHFVIEAW